MRYCQHLYDVVVSQGPTDTGELWYRNCWQHAKPEMPW